ncbi:MAG: sulfite exporter TauE/SafE family protein [Polyangiaceae bacterium]
MIAQLLVSVLAASAVGSLHCVGMCGGFVAFYSVGTEASGVGRLVPHVFYHLGRLVTYAALGALAGSLGGLLDLAGKAVGVGRIAAVLAGTVMVLWGLSLLLARAGVTFRRKVASSKLSTFLGTRIQQLREKPPTVRALLLGLCSTLLPCGFLYAFVVTAAGTGHVWSGMAVMVAFWFGTVPLLLGLGIGAERLGGALRKHVPMVTALVMVGLGVYTISDRVNVAHRAALRLEQGFAPAADGAAPSQGKMSEDCPCHRH